MQRSGKQVGLLLWHGGVPSPPPLCMAANATPTTQFPSFLLAPTCKGQELTGQSRRQMARGGWWERRGNGRRAPATLPPPPSSARCLHWTSKKLVKVTASAARGRLLFWGGCRGANAKEEAEGAEGGRGRERHHQPIGCVCVWGGKKTGRQWGLWMGGFCRSFALNPQHL